jgi:hypothetical protein
MDANDSLHDRSDHSGNDRVRNPRKEALGIDHAQGSQVLGWGHRRYRRVLCLPELREKEDGLTNG